MESRAHAAIGAAVSTLLVAPRLDDVAPVVAVALWTYGVVLSVLVDLDHFVVARLLVGDWRHLRRVLARPTAALWGQSWIFADLEDFPLQRLLSHALLGGVLVAGLAVISAGLALFTAVLLYVHVLADLLRDNELV